MGERFAVTSGAGPRQWVALTRALELCRTQPQPVPWAPSSPAGPSLNELEGPREKAEICV